jgi:hypothetical protein
MLILAERVGVRAGTLDIVNASTPWDSIGTSQSMLAMRDYWSAAQIMTRWRIRNVHQAQRSRDLQCYRWAIRPLPSVKLSASLQTLRQRQGSWESFFNISRD